MTGETVLLVGLLAPSVLHSDAQFMPGLSGSPSSPPDSAGGLQKMSIPDSQLTTDP